MKKSFLLTLKIQFMQKKIYFTIVLVITITANIFFSFTSNSSTNSSVSNLLKINTATAEDIPIYANPYTIEYYSWGCRCEPVTFNWTCNVNQQCMCSWGACACCW